MAQDRTMPFSTAEDDSGQREPLDAVLLRLRRDLSACRDINRVCIVTAEPDGEEMSTYADLLEQVRREREH